MIRISPALQLSIGLVLLTVSILLGADLLGLVPDRTQAILDARKTRCEALAIQFSVLATQGDIDTIEATLAAIVDRDEDILSGGLRRNSDNVLLASSPDHLQLWHPQHDGLSTPTYAQVPIFAGEQHWGTVEMLFTPMESASLLGMRMSPLAKLVVFVALACLAGYMLFMRRALRHLDPTSLVPTRVRAALDALAEGVVLLDASGRIVLANRTFREKTGRSESQLLATSLDDWNWIFPAEGPHTNTFPWHSALQKSVAQIGTVLELRENSHHVRTFIVNAMPIDGPGTSPRGSMVTFDDVSDLMEKNRALEETMILLRKSRHDIEEQNKLLKILATEDPLTGCYNRRTLFEKLNADLVKARRSRMSVACIMVDIDHFKAINDNHGHQLGDQVIKQFVKLLKSELRTTDTIGRYGGEEFCIMLWDVDRTAAIDIAERMRRNIASTPINELSVTASFGISLLGNRIKDLDELIARADSALYISKDSGRNKVICWDSSSSELSATHNR